MHAVFDARVYLHAGEDVLAFSPGQDTAIAAFRNEQFRPSDRAVIQQAAEQHTQAPPKVEV